MNGKKELFIIQFRRNLKISIIFDSIMNDARVYRIFVIREEEEEEEVKLVEII